jgi:seryl-tRNA synthetase
MIDPQELRENPEIYKKACIDKRVNIDIDKVLEVDKNYKKVKQDFESARALQNSVSKEIPTLKGAEKEQKLAEMKTLAAEVKEKENLVKEVETQWNALMLRIPSVPSSETPIGKDDTENVEVEKWGEIPKFNFTPRDHVALGKELDILDIERGVKVAGARNYFLKGDGARLQRAVLDFALDLLHDKGYIIMDPPHIVNYEAMEGTSYFPGGEEQAYNLGERDPNSFLIGTAEVPVCSYHKDEIFKEDELPKRYAGYSPCYRREAGTYGKDTHGIYRIHQFYKVEQVVICKNSVEESANFHKELLGNALTLLQKLELPYRVVKVCTGDMGLGQVFKNDIETWMPSRNSYGETHSCSTFYEFQARRLKIRYKDQNGNNVFCHTLNNTLVASPRILIPILECYQNEDGTVTVPKVLRPYMKGQEVIKCLKA